METSELTIKDLMIGDWVVINNIPRQVTFIDNCINYKIIATGKQPDGSRVSYVGKLSEEVKPIPLTPEILEKNDFVQNTKDSIFEHIGCSIIYGKYYRRTEGNALDTGDCLYPIKYVHQLQQALRLCGIEKEIIL